MLAALFNGNKNIVLSDYSLRTIEKNELLIKVACCGVCGTDKHIYEGKSFSSIPIILGHEFSGVIIEKGDPYAKFNIGDKVVIDPNIYCGHCDYCRKGMVNFCKNFAALGVSLNGGFAEYSIVPASQAYMLPADFDLSIAAFAEPLSCCLRGIDIANIKQGDNVVIIGGGTIGLLMVQLVRNSGASKIILIEPDSDKQKLGTELGADYSLSPFSEHIFEEIRNLTNAQVDVVIECVGSKDTVQNAIKIAGKSGRVVIFGLAPKDEFVTINLRHLFNNELKILSSFLNPYSFKPAVDLLINKKINVEKLVTKQIYLNDVAAIISNKNIPGSVKVQIINN